MTEYICIGVPYFLGQRIEGRTEVKALEDSGITTEIGAAWINIEPDFAAHADPIIATNRALAETINTHADKTPLIFACDCTSSFGAMKGLEQYQPAILWYDAHGDFNTHETSPSGFLGGMPLAMLVGRGDMSYMDAMQLQTTPENKVIITDARDLDLDEGVLLRQCALTHLRDIDDLLTVDLPDAPLYIHFDTDVVDITEMPGMNYPAPNGPSLAQIAKTLAYVGHHAQIAGVLFGLWDDRHQTNGKSLAGTLQLVRDFVAANT